MSADHVPGATQDTPEGVRIRKIEMKYVAACLTAILAYYASGLLLDLIEMPILGLTGWNVIVPSEDLRLWRAGTATALAACIYWMAVRRRKNAMVKWRKELAARARA